MRPTSPTAGLFTPTRVTTTPWRLPLTPAACTALPGRALPSDPQAPPPGQRMCRSPEAAPVHSLHLYRLRNGLQGSRAWRHRAALLPLHSRMHRPLLLLPLPLLLGRPLAGRREGRRLLPQQHPEARLRRHRSCAEVVAALQQKAQRRQRLERSSHVRKAGGGEVALADGVPFCGIKARLQVEVVEGGGKGREG